MREETYGACPQQTQIQTCSTVCEEIKVDIMVEGPHDQVRFILGGQLCASAHINHNHRQKCGHPPAEGRVKSELTACRQSWYILSQPWTIWTRYGRCFYLNLVEATLNKPTANMPAVDSGNNFFKWQLWQGHPILNTSANRALNWGKQKTKTSHVWVRKSKIVSEDDMVIYACMCLPMYVCIYL